MSLSFFAHKSSQAFNNKLIISLLGALEERRRATQSDEEMHTEKTKCGVTRLLSVRRLQLSVICRFLLLLFAKPVATSNHLAIAEVIFSSVVYLHKELTHFKHGS